jgi:hypothetical protein
MLPKVGRFGDLRRRILSWWRSARISISSEARDRNNPISPHQISLQSSIIEQKLHPIRCCSPAELSLRQGQGMFPRRPFDVELCHRGCVIELIAVSHSAGAPI